MLRALLLLLAVLGLALAQAPPGRLLVAGAHRAEVVAVAISEDGGLAASADGSGAVYVWALPGGQPVFELPRLLPPPRALALSEGLLFAATTRGPRAWDLVEGFEVELPEDYPLPPLRGATSAQAGEGGPRVDWRGGALEVRGGDDQPLVTLGGAALQPVDARWDAAGPQVLYADGSLLTWTAAGEPPRARLAVQEPRSFDLSADGGALIVGEGRGPARLLDARTGAELHRFAGHEASVKAVATDPHERRALTGSVQGDVIAWDLTRQAALRVLPPHQGEVRALALSGALAATGGADGVARIVNLETGAVVAELGEHRGGVRALAFSPDGATLLSGDGAGVLRAWSRQGELRYSQSGEGALSALAWMPDGQSFLLARGARLSRHAGGDGAELARLVGHEAEVRALRVQADGALLLSGDAGGHVGVWEMPAGELRWMQARHAGAVTLLELRDGGEEGMSASERDGVQRWSLRDGAEQGGGPKRAVSAAAMTADAQVLVVGRTGGALGLWLPTGWVFMGRLEGDATAAPVVAADPDGELLFTGGAQGWLRLWHAPSRSMVSRVQHFKPVTAFALSPDGELAASADDGGGLVVWAPGREAEVRELDGIGVSVRALRFTDGARVLWVGDARGRLHRVPLDAGERQTWAAHRGPVTDLQLSPDGALLVSTGQDGLAQVWDVAGVTPARAVESGRPLAGAAWSPDGARLLLLGPDRVELRDSASGALACALVAGPQGWRLVDDAGAHAGQGSTPLAYRFSEGAVTALLGDGDPALRKSCLGR
ncbi:MAG: hypothetical protein H6740_21720 [Alphaproteobacteria bacterium]|nr:hypothetical protein [Alphaproteobacteria bacterium]